IRAYKLQDEGADTVEANEQLGFPADMRRYDLCKPMLDRFGIASLKLMTNNPRKVNAMEKLGIWVAERVPLQVNRNPFNENDPSTEAARRGHWLKERIEHAAGRFPPSVPWKSDLGHEAHLEAPALDVARAKAGKGLLGDGALQRHEADELENIDLADLVPGEAGILGQCAQYVARAQLVFFPAWYA